MKKYYGNYLGICVNNKDPEFRGRVQVFIPHIMPALYKDWNKEGQDITIECVGNNLENGINIDIVNKLTKILPWSEAALPVVGTSTAGNYNDASGNFNQLDIPESLAGGSALSDEDLAVFGSLDMNDNLTKFVASIGARETGFSASEANSDYYNSVETVKGQSYRNANVARGVQKEGLTLEQSRAKYGDYGYYQTNQADVDDAVRRGVPREIASAMNNGGGKGNYSLAQQTNAIAQYIKVLNPSAAAAASRGDWSTANNLLNGKWPSLPGGRSHRPGNDSKANAFLTGSFADINDPSSRPPNSALPAQPSPFLTPESPVYTGREPDESAIVSTQVSPQQQGSGGNFESAFRSGVLGSDGKLISDKGTTLCGVGTRKAVGLMLGDSYYTNTGLGEGAIDSVGSGYWTKKGDFEQKTVPSNYKPQQGDVLIHSKNLGGSRYGHAQVYVDNKWHSFTTGDSASAYLNIPGQQAALFRLTDQGKQKLAQTNIADASLIGVDGDLIASSAQSAEDFNGAENDINTNIVKNTTDTQPFTLDTTGMPAGLFAHPGPGALLWVFFREGNPLFPVYFAASYGAAEWQNLSKASSQPLYYPKDGDDTEINSQSVIRPNQAGAIVFTGAVTDKEDRRTVRVAHANGGYYEMKPTGTVAFSPNEYMQHVTGTNYRYCLNNEEWVQGSNNKVTIGNQWTIIGNPSQANIETIEKLTEKVKQINAKLLED